MKDRDRVMDRLIARSIVLTFLLVGMLSAPVYSAFVQNGFTTLEVMVDTATLQVGPQPVVVGADFYSATSQWGSLFPRKGVTSKFEKTGSLLTLYLKDNLGNEATHRYLARSNGARMELEVLFAPSEFTSIAVWDVFLSRHLFAGANFRQSGSTDKILSAEKWEAVEVDELVLATEAGDWHMTLVGDHDVKWKLRSVCDRKWGDPEKQTFSLLYQLSGIPPNGMKLKLSFDLTFWPKIGYLAAVEKRAKERATGYFKGLFKGYGETPMALEGKDLFALSEELAKVSSGINEDRTWVHTPTIIPQPKHISVGKGAFSFTARVPVYGPEEGAWRLLCDDISARGGQLDRAATAGQAAVVMGLLSDPGVRSAAKAVGLLTKDLTGKKEAYGLTVKKGAVVIAANDLAGLVHGVQSFRQVLRLGPSGVEAPVINVIDFPDLAFRGFYLEGAGSVMGTDDFKRLLRNTYSKFHANAVVAELRWSQMKWKSHPEISGPNAKSLADLKASAKEAESLGIEFIPAIFSYGKVDDILKSHPELAEDPAWKKKGAAWCPNRPETYAFLFDLLKEVVEATGCRRIHIGHDEIKGMALCPACKTIPPDDLFTGDVNRIADCLPNEMWAP